MDPQEALCTQALIILFLPLGAFVLQIFFSGKLPRQGDWLPTGAMFVALCIALKMFFVDMLGGHGGVQNPETISFLTDWVRVGGDVDVPSVFSMNFGILVDNLTIVMLVVVTLVSFLVHLYSMGYMHGEVRYNRFFAFLALFTFSMLGLCITSNLLTLFIFWELVGLCSYFLIGFYFEKKSAQFAAIKAFMTTRIGDLGFFLAILIIWSVAGSLEFDKIFESVKDGKWDGLTVGSVSLLTFAGIALFCGPVGKSGQFPLHVWLPDAMEGPTPVSALIHAATMVAAGVYLVGRMFPFMAGPGYFTGDLFSSTPLTVVAWTGGFTAFFAASIAFAQTDIKKVLAYSTVSQLGYMMLGLGVGSVSFALFHLTTHAAFKALLFLGSGSVIHAVHSNEMKDMGGLWKKMPVTWITMGAGTLAIAGLPYLSGFWSKDGILASAFAWGEHHGGMSWGPFAFGMVTAVMTAFYMFRMFFKTFHGEPRNRHAFEHAHESPWTMTFPLVVLAVLAVIAGGSPFQEHAWFGEFVSSATLASYDATSPAVEAVASAFEHGHHLLFYLAPASFVIGVGLAAWFFLRKAVQGIEYGKPGTFLAAPTKFLQNLWYVDAFYYKVLLSVLHFTRHACGIFDNYVIDGIVRLQGYICQFVAWIVGIVDDEGVDGSVRGLGKFTLKSGRLFRRLQTGNLQQYVYASVFLAVAVLGVSGLVIFVILKD